MEKKTYQKPQIKEVKLIMEDTVLTACRATRASLTNSRVGGRACSRCSRDYRAS